MNGWSLFNRFLIYLSYVDEFVMWLLMSHFDISLEMGKQMYIFCAKSFGLYSGKLKRWLVVERFVRTLKDCFVFNYERHSFFFFAFQKKQETRNLLKLLIVVTLITFNVPICVMSVLLLCRSEKFYFWTILSLSSQVGAVWVG